MAALREAKVIEVTATAADLVTARVDLEGRETEAAGFPAMLGSLSAGDRVIVNATGVDLDLGTGGVVFILWNLDGPGRVEPGDGHIIKMRYTPWQTEVLVAEAPESPHHEALRDATSLDGMPVVACGLHSQIAGVVAGIKATAPEARVGYLMTDGAALPLAWSRLVHQLRDASLLDATATAGHAFGGDIESVNVFSGLVALREARGCDAVVVAMGPGVVGTGTALGFTAIEQGQVLDAAAALGGSAVACLRIDFADQRPRHHGVSHHTLTALMLAAHTRATVAVPRLDADKAAAVRGRLDAAGIEALHELAEADGRPALDLLADRGIHPTTMGRGVEDAPEAFLAAGAAGAVAAGILAGD